MKDDRIDSDLKAILNALDRAKEHGLEAEVVWSAMRNYGKFHSSAPETYSVEWAMECGLNEWDI
jgi:hypothetical protein